jgi:hypothetical protein
VSEAAASRPRWAVPAALALVLALVALLFWPVRNDPGEPVDEGLLLVEPEQVLDGKLPNRDFTSFYGPANTYLLSGVYEVFEPTVEAERAVGLAYRLAIVAAVFLVAVPAGLLVAVAAALISGLIMYLVLLPALAWFGGLALALGFLLCAQRALAFRADGRDAGRWLGLAGIAGGLAIAFRPQLGLAIVAGALPLLAGLAPGSWKRLGAWMLAGALPLWVHLVLAGPGNVFENLVTDAFFRSGPQSTLPLPGLGTPDGRLLALMAASLAVLIACAVIAWRRAGRVPESLRLASLALFCLGLLPQTLGRPDGGHIVMVACVSVPLVAVALASPLVLGRLPSLSRQALAAGSCALALALGGWFIVQRGRSGVERALGVSDDVAFATYADKGTWIHHDGRSFPVQGAFVGSINAALAAIDRLSSPGDKIVVGPDDLRRTYFNLTYLYHLLPDLEPGTYYLTMDAGTANREGSSFAADIAGADVVVLGTGTDWHLSSPNSELGSDDATQVLADDFCLREEIPPLRIYTRCAAAPS